MLSGSWKTTVLGVAALLSALGGALTALLDGNPQTSVDLGQITSALAGLGLIFARDNDKSSEDVRAK